MAKPLAKNFKFQFQPLELSYHIQGMSDEETSKFIHLWIKELHGDDAEKATLDYSKQLINETYTFRQKKSKDGEAGAVKRYAKAEVKEQHDKETGEVIYPD